MLNLPSVLLSVFVTVLAWGTYGILLHHGQDHLGHSSLRSFVGVGIAYFLIAVLVPVYLLGRKPEKGYWSMGGTIMSLFAGAVGALGALGVLLALTYKGSPIFVMPLVFGFAPVVNTIVTMWLGKTYKQMTPIFVVGLIMVALGAVGVLMTKPSGKPAAAKTAEVAKADQVSESKDESKTETAVETKSDSSDGKSESDAKANNRNSMSVVLSIIMAAVCWGAYGPFLHIGQTKMGGSRLRPFLCVGISYFAIAVAAPVALLTSSPDGGVWSMIGMLWSIAAGAAGAIGALGIIMAFNFGGKPVFVMPLVFGFAPVVNTLVSTFLANTLDQIRPEFIFCMGVVIAGAVTVLIFAPKSKPHGPAAAPPPTVPIDVAAPKSEL